MLWLLISYLARFELHGDGALGLTGCTGCGPGHREECIPQVHPVLLEHRGRLVKCDSPGDLDIFKGPRSKAKPLQMQQQSALPCVWCFYRPRVPTGPVYPSSKARPVHSNILPHSTQSGIRIHWTTVYQECEKYNYIFLLTMSLTRNMKMKITENFWVQVNVPHLSFNNNSSKEKTQLLKKIGCYKNKG